MAPPTMRTNCAKSVQMTADNPPEMNQRQRAIHYRKSSDELQIQGLIGNQVMYWKSGAIFLLTEKTL